MILRKAQYFCQLRWRKITHPAGTDPFLPGRQHHVCGNDSCVLFRARDPVLQRIFPGAVRLRADTENDRRIKTIFRQPSNLRARICAFEHIHMHRLIVAGRRRQLSSDKNAMQRFFADRRILEFAHRIAGAGKRNKCIHDRDPLSFCFFHYTTIILPPPIVRKFE